MFLYGESRETMMHVGSLLPFSVPEDAPPTMLREIIEEVRDAQQLNPPWNLKLRNPHFLKHPMPAWVETDEVDTEYHIRRSALPSPGSQRELGILVSRLHAIPIDFSRPPWEAHLIEGLQNGQFALYAKMHHSLVDGFTAAKILARSFSTDPKERTPLFFNQAAPERAHRPSSGGSRLKALAHALSVQLGAAREVSASVIEIARALRSGDEELVGPYQAPMSILNGRIGRNRRFATQQYSLDHVKGLAKALGGTLNDLVLALCSASLRRFLMELGKLPEKPLIAMLPVSLRSDTDPGGGNAVGALLASLATDVADPVARAKTIVRSTTAGKDRLRRLSREAIMQMSALTMTPSGLQSITGTMGRVRPQFNVCISNVPGPAHPLYFRGAQLEANYPMSIPIHGQALNITCTSYNGTLNFGFTGCRDTLPSMQRLAVYMGEGLAELDEALSSNS